MPAIIMTAYGTESLAIKALRAGMTDYMKKPFHFTYLMQKLTEILEEKTVYYGTQYEDPVSSEECVMEGAVQYIDDRYMDELTLESVSCLAGMDRFKFCKDFKRKMGMSFTEYLNKTRVEKASHLLKHSPLNITEVALSVGYSSVEYFDRVFKKVYRVSPREYRNMK